MIDLHPTSCDRTSVLNTLVSMKGVSDNNGNLETRMFFREIDQTFVTKMTIEMSSLQTQNRLSI